MIEFSDRLSLSSCWCSARHVDGYAMVEEMRGLGFKRIELSHGIRISLVPGILKAVAEGMVEISSLHNFCPLPNAVRQAAPNLYLPSAADQRERDLWQRYSLNTLNFAVKVGAPIVVMHSGSVNFFFLSPEKRLESWLEKSGKKVEVLRDDEDFRQQCERAMKKIKGASQSWIDRTVEAYRKLLPEVRERGLMLGIENREAMEELPLDAELEDFFVSLKDDAPVAYWHDCGHAQLKHQYGIIDHAAQLEKMAPRLAGFHIHDLSRSGRDHQMPGSGVVDFAMIRSFVQPEHTLVLELSPSLTTEEVLKSRDFVLQSLL